MRDSIPEAIERLNSGSTNIRIISGDHKAAAMLAAVKAGIFSGMDLDENVLSGDHLKSELDELMELA